MDTRLRVTDPTFKLQWAPIAEPLMQALTVVKPFDVFDNLLSVFDLIGKLLMPRSTGAVA